ncbi:hypothetical protein ACFL4W_01205 [Planctomycetota bacterium]
MGKERTPVPEKELYILEADEPSPDTIRELIDFNIGYQLRGLRYFAWLKLKWEKDNPGRTFPGLCAEVDSISGEFRPLKDQRAWSWGDTRGLGLWCYFLQKGRIPDEDTAIEVDGDPVTVNLKDFYTAYCKHIYACLKERLQTCAGKIPFLVDIETNQASDDPRNLQPGEHEFIGTHIFAINAFFQYAMWQNDDEALATAWKILEENFRAAHENRFVNHLTRRPSFTHSHGSMMVSAGALVDTLKTVDLLASRGDTRYNDMQAQLIAAGRWGLDIFLGYHWNPTDKLFCEYLHPVSKTAFKNELDHIICDPGHTAEGVGFFAEFSRWLPAQADNFRFNGANTVPLLGDVLKFVDDHGYSDKGVMYKNIDIITLKGIADVRNDDGQWKTAPWWNIRECAAAACRMYALTKDARMWAIYKRAFNTVYANYANLNIGGLFLQTLDAENLEPLPFHPATGNLDPMHSPRAREREIEALEELL